MRRLRIPVLLAAALAIAVAAAWQNHRARHELCLVITQLEGLLDRSPAEPPGGSLEGAEVPHLLHAGKPGAGHLPNSERSVRAAAGVARAVEVDVAFSSDLVPYLSHEDDLGALAGTGRDRVSRRTAAELDAMTLLDGTRPLRLERFLRELGPRFDRVVLDVKTKQVRAEEKGRALAALIPAAGSRYAVISLCGPVLSWVKALRPDVPVGSETYGPIANRLAGFELLSSDVADLTRTRDARARRLGLHRLYWTAHSPEEARRILAWRPDELIVDLAGEGAPALPAGWRRSR